MRRRDNSLRAARTERPHQRGSLPRRISPPRKMEKQGHVYVLELEGGKEGSNWYVGWSQDIHTRIASHFLGAGALWTRLHRPIAVHSVKPGCTMLETCVTVAMMCRYGWERVRGGSFCTVEMAKSPACIARAQHYATFKSDKTQSDATEA